jgi:hypothetical protein
MMGWRAIPVRPGRWGGGEAELHPLRGGPALLTGEVGAALWSEGEGLLRGGLAPSLAASQPTPGFPAPLTVRVEGIRPTPVPGSGASGAGRAARSLRLPDGEELEERTVLVDGAPGVLLSWMRRTGTVEVTLELHWREQLLTAILVPPVGAAALLLLPDDASPVPRLGDADALSRRRASRGDEDPPLVATFAEGAGAGELLERWEAAIRALDDSPFAEDRGGAPAPPFLLGFGPDGIAVARGGVLAEIGLGALCAGRSALGRAILEALAAESSPPLAPLVLLTAEWAQRGGEPALLARLRPRIDDLLTRCTPGEVTGNPVASLPSLPEALERLAEGVERLGDRGWMTALRESASSLRMPPPLRSGRALPVLGAPPPAELQRPSPGDDPVRPLRLPPVEAYRHPDDPGGLPRRTLHAARLLRSISEELLGVRPDAGWGRIRLAPHLPTQWTAFEVAGIRCGDASITLGYRRAPGAHTFFLRPDRGGVPVNIIFEPSLPCGRIGAVLLEGEMVEVDRLPAQGRGDDGGEERIGIRFQFPLDAEKHVTIQTQEQGG